LQTGKSCSGTIKDAHHLNKMSREIRDHFIRGLESPKDTRKQLPVVRDDAASFGLLLNYSVLRVAVASKKSETHCSLIHAYSQSSDTIFYNICAILVNDKDEKMHLTHPHREFFTKGEPLETGSTRQEH
jgi:hypothetical protein